MSSNIAIVNSSSFGRIFPEHLKRLERLGSVKRFTVDNDISGKELAELLTGFDIIIASVTPFFDKEFFDNKDDLKLITRHGIGYNNIDLEAARNHQTIVSIVPALVERDAVAENNITNLLAVMRQTVPAHNAAAQNQWQDRAHFVGHRLSSKVAGVIGVGNTGSRVMEILRYGFRCEVLGTDPNKSALEIEQFGGKKVELEELIQKSDIICLCASLTDDSYHLLKKAEFQKMKDNVYISNSARGALVDEADLLEFVENGKIAGYATDVLEEEPPKDNHPFIGHDNIVMTPHTSAYIMECLGGMGEKCVEDCEAILKGILPQRAVQNESAYLTVQ